MGRSTSIGMPRTPERIAIRCMCHALMVLAKPWEAEISCLVEAGPVRQRREVGVDGPDGLVAAGPDTAGPAGRILRSPDLLAGFAGVVAEEVVAFPAVDAPLLDDTGDVEEGLGEDARRGARQDRPWRAFRSGFRPSDRWY